MVRFTLLIASLSFAVSAHAQSSAGERQVQVVFIVDDSGSMAKGSDPDRLAVFAVRSLLSMLDDRDEATVIPLHHEASQVPPLTELATGRARLEQQLADIGDRYAGNTPCAPALAAAKERLNAAYRPGIPQVLLFLSDGQCTDKIPSAAKYLEGITAHRDERLQFYLLRFTGLSYTKGLEAYAKESGGRAYAVEPGEPTGLVKPFADALSRSQGYQAYLLTPRRNELAAHRGARRVRLLAVAPGEGAALAFELAPQGSDPAPPKSGPVLTGLHRYRQGRPFRFAAMDYQPGTQPLQVRVKGANEGWKVVALPEYWLAVQLTFRDGSCQQPGAEIDSFQAGAAFCAQVQLVNERGDAVPDVTGTSTSASLEVQGEDGKLQTVYPKWNAERGFFELPFSRLPQGMYTFRPRVTVGEDGGTTTGARVSLPGVKDLCSASEGRLDFGRMVPGSRAQTTFTLNGNFPDREARHVVSGREGIPEGCVTFELNGKKETDTQLIKAGQSYTVGARVAPYCGRISDTFKVEALLLLQFAPGRAMPTCTVPLSLEVDYRIELPPTPPEEIPVLVNAGEHVDVPIHIGGNSQNDYVFKAVLEGAAESGDWPDDHLDAVFFNRASQSVIEDASPGRPALQVRAVFPTAAAAAGSAPLWLRIDSSACCGEGTYHRRVALVAEEGTQEPLVLALAVQVAPASLWACWGSFLGWAVAVLLAALLVLYVLNMFRKTRLIKRRLLVGKLKPLRWDDSGDARVYTAGQDQVRRALYRRLSLGKRVMCWLRANPLVFGFPGKPAYRETVQLRLSPDKRLDAAVRVVFVPELDWKKKIDDAESALGAGRLYVTAPLDIYAKPDRQHRVGELVEERHVEDVLGGFLDENVVAEDNRPRYKLVVGRRRYLKPAPHEEREENQAAGWEVG